MPGSALFLCALGTVVVGLGLALKRWFAKLDAENDTYDYEAEAKAEEAQRAAVDSLPELLATLARVKVDSRKPSRMDAKQPSRELVDVAERIARSLQKTPGHSAYPEAALVLLRANREVPGIARPLRDLIVAADRGGEEAFMAAARLMPTDEWYTVEAFGALRWPSALAGLAIELGRAPMMVLMDTVARSDEDACERLLTTLEGVVLERATICAALHNDSAQLGARFDALEESLPEADGEYWEECQARRMVRRDLDAAMRLVDEISEQYGRPWDATMALVQAVASRDEAELAPWLANHEGREPWDRLPALLGASNAGVDVHATMEEIIDQVTDHSYRLPEVAGALLEYGLSGNGRPEFLDRALDRFGPHPWQLASMARDGLRRLVVRSPEGADACLDVLLVSRSPGPLARRDATEGIVAGHVMVRPDGLFLEYANPLEILVLQRGLRDELPCWFVPRHPDRVAD